MAEGVHGWVAMRPPPLKQPAYAKGYGAVNKGKQSMKSKLKSKLVAFVKEAIRAAVAAVALGPLEFEHTSDANGSAGRLAPP